MKMKAIWIVGLMFLAVGAMSQEKFTISGTVKDGDTGEDMIGADILVEGQPGVGTTSNDYGFYSLTLPSGKYRILYSYFGFETKTFEVDLTKSVKNDVEIKYKVEELGEVEITTIKEDDNVTSTEVGVETIDIKQIETIPVLFGEKDVIKTMQLLPGVKSAGEGNAGFYVRGGGADQNLILLDGAPVYNASHLLGFFSVFNSDALKNVKLYKGSIPAEYGGRLSSVMDIKMKEGNQKKFQADGGIGLISSRLTLQGPIKKDKGSFIVSGRRTYADMFLKLSKDSSLNQSVLYFYDLNAKANYKLGDKDRIFVSGYFGRDNFGFSNVFSFDWGNATGTLRWNHIYGDKLFGNTSLIFSNYNYKIGFGEGEDRTSLGSVIQDWNVKKDFDYFANENNKVSFGANVIYHTIKPGEIESTEFTAADIQTNYSLESALYLSNEQKIGTKLKLNYGLRYSNFTQLGPGDIYSYDADGDVADTSTFARNESVVSYHGLAPRFSANFKIDSVSSIKTSFARTYQYLHLLSNTTSSSPTDVWAPSSINVKPQIGDQISLGYYRNFNDNAFEFSVEGYYKNLQNTIDYKTGAEVNFNPTVEGDLVFGHGRAYGLELYLKKKKGKFTGWISYSLARTEKQFTEVNEGAWYPAKQDRTHDVSLVGMYKINNRMDVSATWVYYTGNAVTFPVGRYVVDGTSYNLYSDRNGDRMPNYHRLDFGLTVKSKPFKMVKNPDTGEDQEVEKFWNSSWNFSIYNVYARKNAYSIEFRQSEVNPNVTEAVKLSLFSIIPSITYNFHF
jgi:hypothetical protein